MRPKSLNLKEGVLVLVISLELFVFATAGGGHTARKCNLDDISVILDVFMYDWGSGAGKFYLLESKNDEPTPNFFWHRLQYTINCHNPANLSKSSSLISSYNDREVLSK